MSQRLARFQPTSRRSSAWRMVSMDSTVGLSPTVLSDETIRRALLRLGVGWKRAKRWLTSPDPAYARKKVAATA